MEARLEALERELIDRHFEFNPGAALAAGVHRHDHELEDLSPAAVDGYCADLGRLRARVAALADLGPADGLEREALLARLDWSRFELGPLRLHRRDPYFHAETLSSQLNMMVIFAYAPLEERALAVIAKEKQIPVFLARARAALEPTAPILRRYGILGAEGTLQLVRRDLPIAFADLRSPGLKHALEESTRVAAEALDGYLAWLKDDYAPGPEKSYALGRETYQGALGAIELETTAVEQLEAWAIAAIAEHRQELGRAAREIDGAGTPAQVVARITGEHPATGQVVIEARRIAAAVYDWLGKSGVVTLPSAEQVHIDDTPAFMRWSFGSMWTPGPYEKAKVRATFYATDADPAWPREQQEEHLTAFSYRGLENLAIHESYPGHFVQALHQHRVASPLRRTFWWGVFGEGWAHYCEQMALEVGFADGAPEARVVQLQEALTRLCRFVNAIRLHTRPDWDFDRGTRFFAEQAWLAEAVARAECERGAFDPLYLRYTLGKKGILELRAECRAALGSSFDLRRFHDALLACGTAPMPVMRALTRLALGIDAPT